MAVTINYNLFRVLAEYNTSGAYSFQARPGIYKIECWGSAAAARSSTGLGGRGGYACAVFRFKIGDKIFVKVGDNNGVNGGGRAGWGGYGGGASDVRVGADTLNNRIIVAGGGGTCGYNTSVDYYGYGGGLSGGNGISRCGSPGLGGTQSGSGGGVPGGFGYGGYGMAAWGGYSGGGGGGWYGGGGGSVDSSADDDSGGGGGAGYVLSGTSYKPSGYIDDSYYYCIDTPMLIAGNLTMPNPNYDSQSNAIQAETVVGNPGIGKVKISYIPQALYFIKHDEKLYIPNKYFFSEYYGKFIPLTEEDASKVYN
ncbi:glycine-rich protein, partial [Clostridium beijerinckii]